MSALNMTMELCRNITSPAEFDFRRSLPLACKPVTARNSTPNYDNGTVPCRTSPNGRRSLQAVDSKRFFELCNCAPLKGEKNAAQYGNSLPSLEAKARTNRPSSGTGIGHRAAATLIRRYLARGAVEPGRLAGLIQVALPGTPANEAAELARTLGEVRA